MSDTQNTPEVAGELTQIQQIEYRFREKDGYKRPTVAVNLPLVTAEGVVAGLNGEDPKVVELIVDAVNSQLIEFVRGLVSSDENFSQDTVDALVSEGKISLTHVANLPRSQRNVITNAMLAEFGKVFVEIAKEVEGTDKRIASEAGASVAATAFVDRLKSAAGKNEILDKLQAMLDRFVEAAAEAVVAEHQATIEWLYVKLGEARKVEELSLDSLD
jgi:hypothetical protein